MQMQTMMTFNPQKAALAFAWTPSGSHHTRLRSARAISTARAPVRAPRTHTMPPEKIEVFKSLESWASQSVLPLVRPVEQSWQPHDFLPHSSLPLDEFNDQVRALRDRTAELPDDYMVVLVGDMITEDALPTYQTRLNQLDGVGDETGSCSSPWAVWSRSWTAEENRHGDLLKTYLYLSGRVDMLMIERTIHYLIGEGLTENNPYLGFVYTSFHERATFISHGNTARLGKESGDLMLARICGTITADEKRHENAYVMIIEKLLEVDPTEAIMAISDMMCKRITMSAHLMNDGRDPHLFRHFSTVAQRLGVYTFGDYANIIEFLIKRWRLEELVGLTAEGRRAQEFVCGLAPRIRRLQERVDDRAHKMKPHGIKFSWIFNKEVHL